MITQLISQSSIILEISTPAVDDYIAELPVEQCSCPSVVNFSKQLSATYFHIARRIYATLLNLTRQSSSVAFGCVQLRRVGSGRAVCCTGEDNQVFYSTRRPVHTHTHTLPHYVTKCACTECLMGALIVNIPTWLHNV